MNSKSFDVLYTGWCQTTGVYGDKYVQSIFEHILQTRDNQTDFEPERLQLSIKKHQLSILKEMSFSNKRVRMFTDYPNIPLMDITYSTKVTYRNKVFVCLIVLGYDPDTGNPVHLYVYEFSSDELASRFIFLLNRKINSPEVKQRAMKIENMLVEDGKIERSQLKVSRVVFDHVKSLDLSSSNSSSNNSSFNGKPATTSYIKSATESVDMKHSSEDLVGELQSKLNQNTSLLLPPRDYDTIHRRHGKTDFSFDNRNTQPRGHLPFSKMWE